MKTKLLSALLCVCLLLSALALTVPAGDDDGESGETGSKHPTVAELRITMGDGYDRFMLKGGSKDTVYPHTTVQLWENGEATLLDLEAEIRGRGNFTWTLGKKPYQIKLSEKSKILGMGKAKKFVLLANHTDTTFMRNPLAFELADRIGLPFTPDWAWVDLYLDDSYQGNYVICEKVEVNSHRVELENEYGVLVELDNNYGTSEPIWFESKRSHCIFVLKDSVAGDEDQPDSKALKGFEMFRQKLERFEDILYIGSRNTATMGECMDMESLIKMFFFQELASDSDGLSSSFFLYMDGADDVIHLGPVWDYDISYGNYENNPGRGSELYEDYIFDNIYKMGRGRDPVSWYRELWKSKAFVQQAEDIYGTVIMPVFHEAGNIVRAWAQDPQLQASSQKNNDKYGLLGGPHVVGDNPRYYEKTFVAECEHLASWLDARVAYIDARYITGDYSELTETEPEKPTEPPTEPPTEAPTEPPTETPAEPTTEPPTQAPTEAPTASPTEPPTEAPTVPSADTAAETPEPTEAPATDAETAPESNGEPGTQTETEPVPSGCQSMLPAAALLCLLPTLWAAARRRREE